MKIRNRNSKPNPVPDDRDHEKDNTVSEYTDSLKVLRNYTVTLRNGTVHHVVANRFINDGRSGKYTFEGDQHSGYAHVAAFEDVASVTDDASVDTGRVWPSPVKGVEYYSLEDVRQALKDLNYYGTDSIVDKVSRQLSVRDDGRYTLDELQTAAKEIGQSSGSYYAKQFGDAALQARKNRVFKAHNGS